MLVRLRLRMSLGDLRLGMSHELGILAAPDGRAYSDLLA
jgi:hypothetical protein